MHKYQPKTPLASISDRIFRILTACALGIGWFVWLWGLSLSALTAGIALGGMLWLCVRQFGKMSTLKKENMMRRMIGGELAIEKLLLTTPEQALQKTASWIERKYSFTLERIDGEYGLGNVHGTCAILKLFAQHPSQPVSIQQLIELSRKTTGQQKQKIILCSTAPIDPKATAWLESSACAIDIITRDELIQLAGIFSPATDEQLSQLGKRKRIRLSRREWLNTILAPSHARRYFWYGIGLSALAVSTRQKYYPFPAAICIILYVCSKVKRLLSGFHTGV